MMKLGIICSAGGSVIQAVISTLGAVNDYYSGIVVATDRECGVEGFCTENSIANRRFGGDSNQAVTSGIADYFREQHVSHVLLYYSRLVTEELYGHFPVFNFHPSLLPAYTGFRAIPRMMADKARFIGATVHGVDGSVDLGPIVAQVVTATTMWERVRLEKISYLQKVYLTFVLLELLTNGSIIMPGYAVDENVPANCSASPSLTDGKLIDAFSTLEQVEGIKVSV